MFVTFEGIDLSGKSTQVALLEQALRSRALHAAGVRVLREPGGTTISESLRAILLDRKHLEMSPWTELFLFSAARAQLVREVIRPALKRGEVVVCDRFYDSTTAYQGFGRGLDLETVQKVNRAAVDGTVPDITFLVDIPVEEVERRRRASGLGTDRMESSGREFYERVRSGYLEIARQEPQRVVSIDGMMPVERVHEAIWKACARVSTGSRFIES
jgi:dTMP kinase